MLNPILSFSVTRRMRSPKTILIVAAWLAVLLGISVLTMGSLFGRQANLYNLRSGLTCYAVLLLAQFFLLVLIAPAMTSGAIAGERERQTLELLLVTNTRPLRIVLGKAMESFAVLLLLIVCGLPVMCLPLTVGAVTLSQILAVELFLLAIAFGAVCVGILASSLSRSTVVSSVISYILLLLIGFVTALPLFAEPGEAVTNVVYDSAKLSALTPSRALSMIPPLLLVNPGYALAALLQGQLKIFSDVMQYHEMGRLLCEFRLMDRLGGQTAALISCGVITVMGAVMLLLAAAAVRGKSRAAR